MVFKVAEQSVAGVYNRARFGVQDCEVWGSVVQNKENQKINEIKTKIKQANKQKRRT